MDVFRPVQICLAGGVKNNRHGESLCTERQCQSSHGPTAPWAGSMGPWAQGPKGPGPILGGSWASKYRACQQKQRFWNFRAYSADSADSADPPETVAAVMARTPSPHAPGLRITFKLHDGYLKTYDNAVSEKSGWVLFPSILKKGYIFQIV